MMAPLASHPDDVNATERIVKCCECELTIALHPAQIGMRRRHIAIGNGQLWYVDALGKWCCPEHDPLQKWPDVPGAKHDPVNHPAHYTSYPVEVIELTEHLNFCRGNAVKYIARAGLKGGPEDEITDLEKACWYIQREIDRLKKGRS